MKKIFLTLLLTSCTTVPLIDNLNVTNALITNANNFSKEMFECKTNFKTAICELVTTINLFSSEIDGLLKKYNNTKDIKYILLCCILRDMRVLCVNILTIIKNQRKYGFTRFTWKLNKACDKKLARKICVALRSLEKKINNEEKKILYDILKVIDKIRLPNKIKLLRMLKFMRR